MAYAKRWWDDQNPRFPVFKDDCTNFISQCLHAGGAPMRGQGNRGQGWWMTGPNEQWSYSWSVAHSLKWYLETSKRGLTATRVSTPEELRIGDVILYDFQDNGRIDHSTIVTSIRRGIPHIHAHTSSSADRHYSYTNSTAYTPQIQYFYYKIDNTFQS